MTLRKILAIVLCMFAMLSVMAVAAKAVDHPKPDDPSTIKTDPDNPSKPLGDQIMEWWESTKVWLDPLFKFSFQGLSKALVVAVQGFIALFQLNFWEGGLFGFLT